VKDDTGLAMDTAIQSQQGEQINNQSLPNSHDLKEQNDSKASAPRVISQSLNPAQVPTPTVTFADNRHIIPTSFMQNRLRSLSNNESSGPSTIKRISQSQPPPPNGDFTFRPTLSDRHAVSWGATTVNKKLRNEVFGEAFLQQPIPIHRHKKPANQHRALTHRAGNASVHGHLRNSNSESSLTTAQQTQSDATVKVENSEESMRRRAMKGAAEKNGLTPIHPKNESSLGNDIDSLRYATNDEEAGFEDKAGTSAPEAETPAEAQNSKKKRRYSSGGLRRKPEAVEDARGHLKYFEEADDAGYKGDVEDDVFKMDSESTSTSLPSPSTATTSHSPLLEPSAESSDAPSTIGNERMGTMLPAARSEEVNEPPSSPRPVNPTQARTHPDKRVEFFLLLEDLTAGMKRPCIMDLKMGTRQYGVDANEKKQRSQRQKCAETTSHELGVRVCGLQVWDAASQTYIFRDKYFGRDLKAGREFQNALTRFLFDGVDYSSVLRHIPIILHKLSQLEVLIKHLQGYRFYAASLLMYYDGDVEDESFSTDNSVTEKETKPRGREIDFKIADFANCVTAENVSETLRTRPCPPQHPEQPDKGFLRGLRSLRKYFLKIQEDVMTRERGIDRKEERGDVQILNGSGPIHEIEDIDKGEVSY
jgi:inositol-hexakisphosphate kinase